MICVSIARTRHKMVLAEHQALAQRGAQLVELRVDWLSRAPDIPRLLKDRPTPVVVTCRRREDGGKWNGSEDERRMVLRTAIVSGADYVDLEDNIARSIPRYGKTKRIVSHHDFNTTPDDLEAIWAEMAEMNPDVIKLVTMANSPSDCIRLLKLVSEARIPTVGFCMGEFGTASRILCGKYGSPFTYAAFSAEREVAPGILTFQEMKDLYRFDEINRETQVFGVLGDPIGHSLSPLLHNTAMKQIGFNGVYMPLRVTRDQLPQMLDDFQWLKVNGYSVTIPHKEAALAKAARCEEIVRQIGAANTLSRDKSGQWEADNTDFQAALDCLQLPLEEGDTLEGKRILMLGAGGVARAIGLGVTRRGGVLVIASRTADRAKALAESLACRQVTWENRGAEYADILINCTPVGMHPNVNETPFQENWLRDEMIVFDTIYNPEQTLLLKEARAHRCRTVSGIEMFVRQAAAQFQRFTGQPAPLETLKETLRHGISAAKG
ncbi:MAG: shikimate dehydrogenase [Candidatus Saccharimonas sp.]|nr:shikimate dehydrogenase [Planctomycetaceae bacterium]